MGSHLGMASGRVGILVCTSELPSDKSSSHCALHKQLQLLLEFVQQSRCVDMITTLSLPPLLDVTVSRAETGFFYPFSMSRASNASNELCQ